MAELSYGRVITELAEQSPDRITLYLEEVALSIGELERRGNRMARAFQSMGVGEGDIVTIALANSIELLVAMLATWKLGAMPNPISEKMPQMEVELILERAEAALLVGAEPGTYGDYTCIAWDYCPDASLADGPLADPSIPGGERALASGGSTGKPKLIIPKARAVYDPATASHLFKPKQAVLVPGPIYHAVPFSATWQGIFHGSTVVVMKRFDANKCLALIEKHKVDRMSVVPTMMARIWKLPEAERLSFDLSSLEFVMSGGAPLPAWLMAVWIEWLGPEVMHEAFGPSERLGGTFITGVEWLQHPGSVGKPMPSCRMKALDEDGNECGPGEMGEIYIMPTNGPGSTYSYRGSVGKKNPDGWETVGDMGYFDEDGYLYLGDRRSDMILSGGRNIYPAEVEGALEAHSAVRSCAVLGLPDDEDMGQRIHAVVDCKPGSVSDEVLIEHLKERLSPYKIPRSYDYVNEPLRNDAGKVRRSALREERIKTQIQP